MWLTKAQLEGEEKKLYINLICSSKPCDFKLNLDAYDDIEMDFNTQFNLYVTENNKNVKVLFYSFSQADESDFITIWALGNKNVKANIELDDDKQYEKYSNNNIFKIKKSSINKSTFELTIIGEVGDVINIGSTTTYINDYNTLTINNPEIKGFLKNNYSNEDCYKFSKDTIFYLSGIIHSKIAEIYYKNDDGEEKTDTITIIKNGSFIETISPPNSYSSFYFCIRFPIKEFEKYDIEEIFYSLQVTSPGESENKIGLYSPQLYGEIYPRRLNAGEEYSYIGITPDDSSKQISFDMISQFGFPDMIYRLCKNYPICDDNEDINPRSITGHTTHKMKYQYKSPMDPTQYTILVKCLKTNVTGPCAFKTSFNSDVVKINLKEDEPFSQYLLEGEKDLYKVDFSGETKIKKIYVDLIVFSGDVNFNTNTTLTTKKIYNSNKIFFIIDIDKIITNKEIEFNILASKNSYYCIEFMFVREDDDSWLTNIIEPGISYLITIDPEAKDSTGEKSPLKIVRFTNLRLMEFKQFLVQFYSLNCKLNVTSRRVDEEGKYYYKEIASFDQYYQDNLPKNVRNDYEYMLYVTETDSSKYNNKLCMVYASSLEIENNRELDERQIVISDNEPKQMAFNKANNSEIEYLYPHSNPNNDVIINLNFLDVGEYQLNTSFDHQKENVYGPLTGNELIYIPSYELKSICKKDEICPIIIKIRLTKVVADNNPKLLISVKSVQDSSPTYLTKNRGKLDFLLGKNWQYYYTDLGENEEGDVLVSYRRGSGRLFGKIVSKNADKPEEGATWREMYKFPKLVNESLYFYGYIKKIIISKNETSHCRDGCYLLLSLKTSIETPEEYNYDFREHPFSIIIHTRSSDKIEDIPIINIPLSEYIIGNLFTHEDNNIYEYYTTIFTHNSHKISIDFQSKVVNLYINVGANNKPRRNEKPDFEYLSTGQDTIFEISKKEFIDKCIKKGIEIPYENSLLGLSMTIGLWTEKTDSLYTTVYSLKIHLPFDERLNIYEVKSDQKTLCKTEVDRTGKNRCLFMVFYFGIEPINHLLLYPFIQDHSSYEMFANYIMKENYENFDYSYLNGILPHNEEAKFSTRSTGLDYLYIPHGFQSDNYVFVNVVTKQPTTVELLSSLYTYDLQLSPNPSSPQLFLLTNDNFTFEFTTYEELTINIQSIGGGGTIYWKEDDSEKYTIHGKGQAITLANGYVDKNNNTKVFLELFVKNKNQKKEYDSCPGFAFFISYKLRPANGINLDEIEIGKPSEFTYRADFPIYIYSEITDFDKDVNFYVNLYKLIGENYLQFTNIPPFEINGTIVKNSDLMNVKLNPELLNNLKFDFNGTYDSMIKTGFVLFKKEDINKKDKSDGLSIIIKISKNKNYNFKNNFTEITLEAAAFQENSSIPVSPDLYHYGKLSRENENNIYKLKTSKAENFMRIQYSPNSLHTKYTVTTTPGNKQNSFPDSTSTFVNGKTIITIDSQPDKNDYIYLNIFHNDAQKAKTEKTTNYAFKYMTSNDIKKFPSYELKNNEGFELETKKHGKQRDYIFTITPLSYKDIDITYFIKFVKKDDWVDGESDNSIALRESKSLVEELTNIDTKSKFTKKYENINEIDYRYLQIIALVRDNDGNVEFVSYKSIYRKDSNTWKIILIIIAFIIVAIIVIYMVHLILKRRRNLDKKVEKISGPMVSRISEVPAVE